MRSASRLTVVRAIGLAAVSALTLPLPLRSQDSAPAFVPRLDSLVLAELARTRTPGAQVAVVVDGRLAYAKGYGVADIETGRKVTEQTLFRVGSVTKMVTAATLTQLAAEGKLDLEAPISTYVKELAGKRVGTVSTHQLLTHSAGWLDNAVAYGRMGEGALGEVMREVGDTLFFTAPSRVISYSNPGYSMAGYVAEQAGGARFAALTERLVLRKAGMALSTFRPLEVMTRDFSHGHIGAPAAEGSIVRPFTENTAQWAAGFLFSNTSEFARFTILLMNGGELDGQRVLAAEAVAQLTTGHQAIPGTTQARYGYGLNIATRGTERVWQHGGAINGFDAQVTMLPDRKLAVIVFDNRTGAPLQGIVDLVAKEAAGIVPPTPTPLPAERAATAEERARIVGTYRQGNTEMSFVEENGALKFRQRTEVAPAMLVGDERVVVGIGATKQTILLVRGTDGRVEYLHIGLRALARQP